MFGGMFVFFLYGINIYYLIIFVIKGYDFFCVWFKNDNL